MGNTEYVMTVIKTAKKGQYLNSQEKYHIYKITKQNLQMNDSQKNIIPYLKH
jgi:hypothetical protein